MAQVDRDMSAPPHAVYSSLEELLSQANGHAQSRGYKLVVVRSKTNAQGQKTWVHLACDRHGTKRNTHNLTPETRKKNRRSRRCECPMHCAANKTTSDLWELTVRNGEHNHGPYEPTPKKKKDMIPPPPSELVNLPLLQTPSSCIADFCLIPLGGGQPSVSAEVAEVQRLLKRSGLSFSMHSAGTTVEGTWDEVTRIIGQAHSLLHGSGVVRIHTDIRIGTRTDKKQTADDKVAAVQAILSGEELVHLGQESDDDNDHDMSSVQDLSQALQQGMNSNIHPGLDRMVPPSPYMPAPGSQQMGHQMQHQMGPSAIPPHMAQHMAQISQQNMQHQQSMQQNLQQSMNMQQNMPGSMGLN